MCALQSPQQTRERNAGFANAAPQHNLLPRNAPLVSTIQSQMPSVCLLMLDKLQDKAVLLWIAMYTPNIHCDALQKPPHRSLQNSPPSPFQITLAQTDTTCAQTTICQEKTEKILTRM